MHKGFYASGFLFNSSSQQILLQQTADTSDGNVWGLFGRNVRNEQDTKTQFQAIFIDLFSFQLNLNDIFEVYSYESPQFKNIQTIYYAEIPDEVFTIPANVQAEWFSFKQIQKLPLVPQAKHDIMIAKRVIESHKRRSLGLHTIG